MIFAIPISDVHSEHVTVPGGHPGRAANPIVKVHDVAWLEFEKPDLEPTERFAEAFGFTTALRTPGLPRDNADNPCAAMRIPRSGSQAGSMNYNPIVLTDAELESILIRSLS